MKKIISIIQILALSACIASAQQMPKFSQFYINPFSINPAYAGYSDSIKAFVHYRNEMVGLRGAPITEMISLDGKSRKYKFGLGLNAFFQQQNIISRKGLNVSYSYQVKLKEEQKITFGISVGVVQNSLAYDQIVADSPEELVTLFNYKPSSSFNNDIGFVYSLKNLEVGFSANNLFNKKTFSDKYSLVYQQNPSYNITGIYRFDITSEFKSTTSILMYSPQGLPFRTNLNTMVTYRNQIWGGITYGIKSNIGLIAGIRYDMFTLGYVYEYALSQLAAISGGAHEILVGYNFGKR